MRILIGFILIGASFTILDPAQKKFIDELNGIRKEVAENLTITNMHKLEYSKELAGMAELVVNNGNVTGFHESWRHTLVKNYSKGQDELLGVFDRYHKIWVDGRPPNKSIEVHGLAIPVEHLVPLHTKIGCALMNKKTTPFKVICSLGPETTTNLIVASQHLETLKPDNHLPIAPPVGSISFKLGNRLFKNSNQTEDLTNSTVKSNITPIPLIYGPKTTVETELDRLIAKYQREEQDGDIPSEEDEEKYVFSGRGKVSMLISVVLAMITILIE